MQYEWCLKCHLFQYGGNNDHEGHQLVTLGNNQSETISALDDIIQYGQDTISGINSDIDNAKRVRSEISAMKEKFKAKLHTRIDRIVRDVRDALDEQAMALMADVGKKVIETEKKANDALEESSMQLDTANTFLMKAAVALPDDDGNFDEQLLNDIFIFHCAIEDEKSQKKTEVKSVAVNIKFPNTMKMKAQCLELSKNIIGEIENTQKPSLLDARRPSIDVVNIIDFNK